MMNENSVKTFDQFSAGGVVYRLGEDGPELIVIQVVPEMRWQLPKGVIDPGETIEGAALREVREESGVVAEIVAPLDRIEYWFYANYDGERRHYHKFVDFYLMRYLSGDVADHDDEVAEARWVGPDDAIEMLSFKSEREIVELGLGKIDSMYA